MAQPRASFGLRDEGWHLAGFHWLQHWWQPLEIVPQWLIKRHLGVICIMGKIAECSGIPRAVGNGLHKLLGVTRPELSHQPSINSWDVGTGSWCWKAGECSAVPAACLMAGEEVYQRGFRWPQEAEG